EVWKREIAAQENYRVVPLRCVFVATGLCCGPRCLSAPHTPNSQFFRAPGP
ncbi:hypothetical protein NEUTE1DRAFT_116153, partial [Neurospora tetrasperma FGSC 2508]